MSPKLKPIHPGEVLKEEFLVPSNMSVNQLALALRISTPRLNQIVRGESAVTPNTALRLARYLNTTPDFWLNLQTRYDLDVAEDRDWPAIEQDVRPREAQVLRAKFPRSEEVYATVHSKRARTRG
jgi:antitoxin HigA-1